MNEQTGQKPYMVSVFEPEGSGRALIFTFVPKGLDQEGGQGGTPKRVPQFIVAVRQEVSGLAFDWGGSPDDPGVAREEIQAEISARMKAREIWIDRVTALVGQVEQWAREMNWSTRRVEKKIDDPWIGKHRVPALLMQEDTCRALLEPVGQSSRGEGGVVDLYLMPAYDDIAVFFFYNNRWNVHHNTSRGTNAVVPTPEADAKPLSKEALAHVFAEMKRNAA